VSIEGETDNEVTIRRRIVTPSRGGTRDGPPRIRSSDLKLDFVEAAAPELAAISVPDR